MQHYIEKLTKLIFEEIEDAEEYIHMAFKCRHHGNKHAAEKFLMLAEAEVKHAEELRTLLEHDIAADKEEMTEHAEILWKIRQTDIEEELHEVKREFMLYRT